MFKNCMQYLSAKVFEQKQETNNWFGSYTDRSFLTQNISKDTFKYTSLSLIYF